VGCSPSSDVYHTYHVREKGSSDAVSFAGYVPSYLTCPRSGFPHTDHRQYDKGGESGGNGEKKGGTQAGTAHFMPLLFIGLRMLFQRIAQLKEQKKSGGA
jgi:hypothetical protein